jgi:hypothetical protein
VDDARRFRRGVAGVNRPGADFLFARGEIRPQAEQMIRGADERADAGFLTPSSFKKFLRLGGGQINQVALDLRADDDGFAGDGARTYSRTLRTNGFLSAVARSFSFTLQAKIVGLSVSRKKNFGDGFFLRREFERERGFAGVEVRLDFFSTASCASASLSPRLASLADARGVS